MKNTGWGFELGLLGVCLTVGVASGIAPADRLVWFTEISWAVLAVMLVGFFSRFHRFSKASLAVVAFWVVLQCVGAHWTFEHVPMGWLTEPLGLERNPFDRIAHFAIGLYALPFVDLLWGTRRATSRGMAAFTAVCFITALAGLWEDVEWLYAVTVGGTAGQAFLGAQGYIWDAQKDILCDFLGALTAVALWLMAACRKPCPESVPVCHVG